MDNHFTSYKLEDRSHMAFIKRQIRDQITHTSFSKTRAAKIDIIVSEITSNLIKHTPGGELLYRVYEDSGVATFDVIAIDNGLGIADPVRMMKDGISTTGTLGHGLGSIQRLSDFFQLYSRPGWGTIMYSSVTSASPTARDPKKKKTHMETRGLNIPKPPELLCGDGYAVKEDHEGTQLFLGDGLGHGAHAHAAVQRAKDIFVNSKNTAPVEILREMHLGVKKTRGLVGAIANLNYAKNEWRICGIGNIAIRLYTGLVSKTYMSYNGIIGLNIPNTMNDYVVPCEKGQHIIMCSDGIRTRWDLMRYAAIQKYDLILLAAALYKDFSRQTDDTSVLIGRVSI